MYAMPDNAFILKGHSPKHRAEPVLAKS